MINKQVKDAAAAVAGIKDGATIFYAGFGQVGEPAGLVPALLDTGARNLTVVANNSGTGEVGLALLIREGRVAKLICSFPRTNDSHCFDDAFRAGKIEVELLPQGTLSERMRAAGAGIGGFYVRVGADTKLAAGKETRMIDGKLHVLEAPLKGDVALIRADRADRWGNLVYRKSARNFNPVMAMGAALVIAQVREMVPLGSLDPETIHTPGIFVDRVVAIAQA